VVRGYLNDRSFPAESLEAALSHLDELRAGITVLLKERTIENQIRCTVPASQLPMSPAAEPIAAGVKIQGGRFRDTILFFLHTLDQSSPAYAHLDLGAQAAACEHVLDDDAAPGDAASPVLIACALDEGVLLSIGTSSHWRKDRVTVRALLPSNDNVEEFSLSNVCDADTAVVVSERLGTSPPDELVFENWEVLTNGARRSAQIDEWFAEVRSKPGLEASVMRALRSASAASYLPDGTLVKKLRGACEGLHEVRIFHGGSNNVRLLFARRPGGEVLFGFGGIKTSPDWYEHACGQALRLVSELRSAAG
jgi:hypothetical protein